MRRFLDTSILETYKSGKYTGKYDWINNIGKELYFEYDDLAAYIKIINYEKLNPQGKITLQYKNNTLITSTQNFTRLKCPSLFNMEKQSNKYKYNINDIIYKFNDSIKVINQIRIKYNRSTLRGYLIECLDCGYKYETREDKMSTCHICGKRTSYSERFIFSILKQANISFVPQKEFTWFPNRWYDIYLPDYNVIIEIHGEQHYKPVKLNKNESAQENFIKTRDSDKIKYNKALKNNLKYYIINASVSKNLYIESLKTLDFIDFSNISEIKCEEFANYKSIIKECELWNKKLSIETICSELNESKQIVQSKLRLGDKYGICIYDKHINMSKPTANKKVKCITTDEIFDSIKQATNFYNLSKTGISDCLSGKCLSCGRHPITEEKLKWEYYRVS